MLLIVHMNIVKQFILMFKVVMAAFICAFCLSSIDRFFLRLQYLKPL